eukprot:403372845
MFLQSILQQRLKTLNDEDQLLKSGHMQMTGSLPKPKKIGSIKNGKVNYPKDQNFFHSSDIAGNVRESVKHVKELTNPDILGTKKNEWNLSNATVGHKLPENHQQNLFNVRFGLKDEKILPPKDPRVYSGTDTRDIYHDGWEVSHAVPIPREQYKKIHEDTKVMQQKTKIKNEQLVRDKYIPPHLLTKHYNESLRQEKEELAEMKDAFMKQTLHELPRATKERVEAIVFKKMYEAQHIAKEPEDPQLTLKPDMTRTLKNTKQKQYYHNGKWELNRFDNQECWSCCMNADKDNEGCVAVVKDKQKWILSSYT